MTFDFRIALYTSLLDTEHSRLGHLWHRSKNSQPPEWYGQPWPELDPVFAAQSVVHRVGSHEFSLSSATRRRRSTGLLTSVLRSFGVLDFQMERLRERSFTAKLSLVDYVRPTLAPAALSRLIGYSVPPTFSGGHWFACQAQHQAMSGTLELAYDRSDGYDLAAELEVRSNPDNGGPGTGGPMSVGRADNAESGIGDRRTDNGASTPVPSQPERVEHSGILPETAAHSVPTSPAPLSVPLASPVVPPAPYAPAGRLSLQEQSAGVQLFSFSAQRPLVFGVSLIHIWEKNGRFSAFGNKHEDLDYAGS